MASNIDGFYSAYLRGSDDFGFAMIVLTKGRVVGADPLGVQFDGVYHDVEGGIEGKLSVIVPPNATVVQGTKVGPEGLTYNVPFRLPDDFFKLEFIPIETPLGPVNAKFVRLRGIDD